MTSIISNGLAHEHILSFYKLSITLVDSVFSIFIFELKSGLRDPNTNSVSRLVKWSNTCIG